jgi:ABC-type polysaccharide/polyol phosphate export permease
VYFPTSVLPGALHAIANLLPFTWGVDVMRQAVLGGDPDITKLAVLVAFAVASLPAALALFGTALRHSRRRGTLGHY